MVSFILSRLLQGFLVLFGVSLLSFLIIKLSPGDFLDRLRLNPSVSPETLRQLESLYGLDKNPIEQFFSWFLGALRFDFGYSLQYHAPVWELIRERLPNTVALSLAAGVVSWTLGFLLGVLAAFKRETLIDRLILAYAYTFASIPNFFLAFLLMVLAVKTGILPVGGARSPDYEELSALGKLWDYLKHLALPASVLALVSTAALIRLVRSAALEVLNSPLNLYLRAKGAPAAVRVKHLLRNMLNPFITLLGFEIAALVSGAGLVEIVTGWPGLGSLMLEAVLAKDLFLVMGALYVGTLMLLVGNLIADLLLALNDPRIRDGEVSR